MNKCFIYNTILLELYWINLFKGLFIWSELAQVGGLTHPGEVIFIPRSYGIFYLILMKKFVISLEKDCLDT